MKQFKTILLFLIALVAIFAANLTASGQTPVSLLESRNGRFNFISTGGTLRSQPNSSNPCSRNTTSNANLSGLPATATVRRAYLYWAGSGQTPDNSVTFDGINVTATRTFSALYTLGANNYYFFGAVADVTARVQARRNISYSFTNLTFQTADQTGQPYCSTQAVLGGWSLFVVYEDANESPKRVNLYEGFELFRNSSRTLTLDGLSVPPSPQGNMTVLAWEGDPSLSGGGENFSFNGNVLTDALNASGNVFNSTINGLNNSNSHGVDLDTFDVGSFLTPGSTSASATIATGDDLVLFNAVAISGSTLVADLELTKTANTNLISEGGTVTYTLSLLNRGPNVSAPAQIRDLLPAGLTYVSSSTPSGSYNPTTGIWSVGSLAVNATTTLTITATANAGTAGTNIVNVAEITQSGNFDPDSTENNGVTTEDDYSSVTVAVRPNANVAIVKTGPATADVGQPITYSLAITNPGTVNVTGLTINDVVPAGVTVSTWTCAVIGTASCGTANGTGNNVTLNGNINAGAGNQLTITINGTVAAAGSIVNTATVTVPANLNDPVPANNTSTVTTVAGIRVSGTVWQDADGSAAGTFTNIQTGSETGTNAGGLFAIAVGSNGLVISSAAVAANGQFTISGVSANATGVTIRLANVTGVAGQAPPATNLPAGWINTSPLITAPFNTAGTNITGLAFGIERLPTAVGTAAPSQPNPGAANTVAVPSAIIAGTDPDGTITTFRITTFPSNALTVTINGTTYNSGTFPVAGVSVTAVSGAFPATAMTVDPIDGPVTVSIQFVVIDNAGQPSAASSTATMPFGNSLPPAVGLTKSCTVPADCETVGQLPGTDLTYAIAFQNTGGQPAQGLIIVDAIPANTDFRIGTASITPAPGMTFVIEYSNDYNAATPAAATWSATPPTSGGGGAPAGYNALVRAIRWRSTSGSLSNMASSNAGSVQFTVRIR